MSRRLFILLLGVTLAGCAGGSRLEPVDPPAPLTKVDAELQIETVWVAEIGKGVGRYFLELPPVTDEQHVYAASRKGEIFAFRKDSGRRVWRVELGVPINSGPTEAGRLLLFGGDAEVLAVDKKDGGLRWRARVSSEVLARPVVSGGTVVVRTADGGVSAHSLKDGTRLWRQSQQVPALTLRGMSAPAVEAGIVVVGFGNGQLAGFELSSGRPIWETPISVPRGRTELERLVDLDADPRVDHRVVYVSSYHGRTAALTLDDGRPLWERTVASYSGIALTRSELFLSDVHGDVWALSRRNGGSLWRQPALHGRELSAPVIQGNFLVVGDYEGYLHWLARDDGHLAGRVRLYRPDHFFPVVDPEVSDNGFSEDRRILAAPVIEGDRVYATDKRGVLGAFRVSIVND